METLIVVIALLVLTVACVVIGERLHLPYPVLMLLAAMGITFIPGIGEFNINPELILPLFLPPLLFAAAIETSWAVFAVRWRTLIMLAVVLTATTAFAVGGALWLLIPQIAFPLALTLGAMVAPPDPVAVESVSKPARLSRRVLTVLQTEGLFNDAVAIVVFQTALAAVLADDIIGWEIGFKFFIGAALAVAIGFVVGWLYRFCYQWVNSHAAAVTLTLVVPFVAYLLAEEVGASGVVAVVVTALETKRGLQIRDAEFRVAQSSFWEATNLGITGLAFGLVGMDLRIILEQEGWNVTRYILPVIVVAAVVIVVRFLIMLILLKVVERDRRGRPEGDFKIAILLTWCGMRGVATLALALSLPYTTDSGAPIEYRSMIIVIAGAVLLVTLVPTGLLLPWLTKTLGVQQSDEEIRQQLIQILNRVQQKAWAAVGHEMSRGQFSPELQESLRNRFITLREELSLEVPQELEREFTCNLTEDVVAHEALEEELEADLKAVRAEKAEVAREDRVKRRQERIRVMTIAADAAREEVIKLRDERDVDPVLADIVLRKLDYRALATPALIDL